MTEPTEQRIEAPHIAIARKFVVMLSKDRSGLARMSLAQFEERLIAALAAEYERGRADGATATVEALKARIAELEAERDALPTVALNIRARAVSEHKEG